MVGKILWVKKFYWHDFPKYYLGAIVNVQFWLNRWNRKAAALVCYRFPQLGDISLVRKYCSGISRTIIYAGAVIVGISWACSGPWRLQKIRLLWSSLNRDLGILNGVDKNDIILTRPSGVITIYFCAKNIYIKRWIEQGKIVCPSVIPATFPQAASSAPDRKCKLSARDHKVEIVVTPSWTALRNNK